MENSGELVHVPEDIIGEILRRLPVKSLLRFQCVCKSWCNLIQSDQFVESHRNDINRRPRAIFFMSGLRSYLNKKDPDLTKMKLSKTMRVGRNYRIDGHSNGIICLTLMSLMNGSISLWNPALRQRRVLPPASGDENDDYLYRLGFGYDSKNRDYKVVSVPRCRILHYAGSGKSEMYSLKSDSWKPIHCDHLRFLEISPSYMSDRGCSFKGRLYWMVCCHLYDGSGRKKMFLVVFDLTGEKFLEFEFPKSVHKNHVAEYTGNLGVFKGRLSWLRENSKREYEIWSSEDDSCAPESWTRAWKFTLDALQLRTRIWKFSQVALKLNKRLALWNVELIGDESMLVKVNHRVDRYDHFVYIYDFQMNGLKVRTRALDDGYDDEHLCIPVTNYVETLVPVIREPPRRCRHLPATRSTPRKRRRKSSLCVMP